MVSSRCPELIPVPVATVYQSPWPYAHGAVGSVPRHFLPVSGPWVHRSWLCASRTLPLVGPLSLPISLSIFPVILSTLNATLFLRYTINASSTIASLSTQFWGHFGLACGEQALPHLGNPWFIAPKFLPLFRGQFGWFDPKQDQEIVNKWFYQTAVLCPFSDMNCRLFTLY